MLRANFTIPLQKSPPDLFRPRLDEQINMKHPLVRLAGLIDWEEIHRTFAGHFTSGRGRPALSPRLVAGLLYLQHAFASSVISICNARSWLGPRRRDKPLYVHEYARLEGAPQI